MKSKFTQVVLIKKRACDVLESKIFKARAHIRNLEDETIKCKELLDGFVLPKSGSISEINQNLQYQKIMRNQIDILSEKISLANTELSHFTTQYKNANLEFEKIKYLEEEDFKAQLKMLKQKESNALDEFATMKFGANIAMKNQEVTL